MVGPVIAKYLLRAYDGQLSQFVFALRSWANSNRPEELPGAQMLEDFIAERFGPQHHLTSLFRFALCSHKELPNHNLPANLVKGLYDPKQLYQLGSHVHVLADLHDCQFLIGRIKEDAGRLLLEDTDTGSRSTYLVSVSGDRRMSYQIDPGLEAMLTLFAEPHTCTEVTNFIRKVSGVSQLDSSYFAPLVDAGILVAHSAPTS
jgi:hypothetical protein